MTRQSQSNSAICQSTGLVITKPSQKQRIIDWFYFHGTLTKDEAKTHLGIGNLGARILELRERHSIKTVMKKGHNQYGDYEYAEYSLIKPSKQGELF